ncbi:RTA1 like protein [Xylogone sp. PMI_703]|nr:RTA1 like protein [Xylogone sp. PMI_703]
MSNSTSHPSIDDPDAFVFYRYSPSLAGAIVFIICFFTTTLLHVCQLVKYRTYYFIPLIIGGCFEWVGYIGRVLSSHDQWALGPYIMQTLLLLVAPALFAASIYMILGRIIILVDGEAHSLIKKKWLTKFFVSGDILSFVLQGAGGGIMASGSLQAMRTGEHIIVTGLSIQIIFFTFFIIVATLFHYRICTVHTAASSAPGLQWQKRLFILYAASLLILIRSVFRVVEYVMGNDGFILRHEIFLYIFDALLMFVVLVLFNVVYPGQITRSEREKDHTMTSIESSTRVSTIREVGRNL